MANITRYDPFGSLAQFDPPAAGPATDCVGGDARRVGVFTVGGGVLMVGALTVGVGALAVGAFADWAEPEAGKINPRPPTIRRAQPFPTTDCAFPIPQDAQSFASRLRKCQRTAGLQLHIAYRVKCRRLTGTAKTRLICAWRWRPT